VSCPGRGGGKSAFVKDEPGALVFPGQMGGPLRRGNFNKMSGWPHAVRAIGMEGLHFHDLRHAGNHLAAGSGAGLKDLMARMGHDSERAALIYRAMLETCGSTGKGMKEGVPSRMIES
jgi:integrase